MQRSAPAVAGLARSCADARVCIRVASQYLAVLPSSCSVRHAWSNTRCAERLALLLGSSAPTLAYLIAYCP